jgi:opacity protein-like surface antigen
MRRIPGFVFGLVLLCVPPFAFAQQPPPATPFFEISGTYSYVRVGSTSSNYNGASMSFALNPNHWLGIVGDFGGYHEAVMDGFDSSNLITYLFGPRVSYRSQERVTPYVQVLFGGAYDTYIARSALAMTAGGGLDYKVAPHVSLRLAQAEYLMTRFGQQTQNNLRISTGIVFSFGEK